MTHSDNASLLTPCQLKVCIDPADLPFATTADTGFQAYRGVIGQQGARDAIAFGISMTRPGYNIFVSGDSGTGRLSLARQHLEETARQGQTPGDWLYLCNFANPREPLALNLPTGQGKAFLADMEVLVDSLFATFPAAFEHPAYQRGKAEIERDFAQRYNRTLDTVERRAQEQSIGLFREGENISFSPMVEGKAASEEDLAGFSEEDKAVYREAARALENYMADLLAELPQWRREANERLRQLHRRTVSQAIEPMFKPLVEQYAGRPEVLAYLESVGKDLPGQLTEQALEEWKPDSAEELARRTRLTDRYVPRLLVCHAQDSGAPVVVEDNPSCQNLFGRVEYTNEQGQLLTHYRLINPGSLHLANGGYLLLEADKLANDPELWPTLKRALKNRTIRIDPPSLEQAPPVAVSLNPQPIPLALKIVLVGSREQYYLLQELDGEFNELFRVLADFDDYLPRDRDSILRLAAMLKAYAECSGFAPLSAAAVARLIDFSSRLAEHQGHLSARIGDVYELTAEAELQRRQQGGDTLEERHIAQALANKEQRLGRISRQLLEDMLAGVILIATAGECVGKINGLTVLEMGGSRFGMPARITATVAPGGRGVVDIEREVSLGQAIHSKGVMILSGFLAHRFAKGFPLRLSATIALEQSYGYVDGDSAALAELLALISALTRIPLRQSLAVTGSINQYGEVQAVGGVNEKIEGFFQLCQARGLDGGHGVLIPRSNAANLMLAEPVVEAVRRGAFAVHVVGTVDEALHLLTGRPPEAVYRQAIARLGDMAKWGPLGGV